MSAARRRSAGGSSVWTPARHLGVLTDAGLGIGYLLAWTAPALVGGAAAAWLVLGVELEAAALLGAFILAMALVLVAHGEPLKARLGGAAMIGGLIVFAGVEVARHRFWWPAAALGGLLANRLSSFVGGRRSTEDARMETLVDALYAVGSYVLAVGVTFYLPVPAPAAPAVALPEAHARWCGLAADLVEDFFESAVTGSWCEEPHRALAGGALYFFVSAFRGARRLRREGRR